MRDVVSQVLHEKSLCLRVKSGEDVPDEELGFLGGRSVSEYEEWILSKDYRDVFSKYAPGE